MIAILEKEMVKKTAAEWCEIFEQRRIPYSPINNLKQICEDAHIRHRKMLVEIDQPVVGKMHVSASPFKLSETPGEVYAPGTYAGPTFRRGPAGAPGILAGAGGATQGRGRHQRDGLSRCQRIT